MSLSANSVIALPLPSALPFLRVALAGYDPTEEVKAGRAQAFAIAGAMVLLRLEGVELVVVAFEGRHKLSKAAGLIVVLAGMWGCESIRVHTERRGELRFLRALGLPFELVEQREKEMVLRMVIDGRQEQFELNNDDDNDDG